MRPHRSTLRGDVVGALTAAILSIPMSIGYGVLALQPLGEPYVSHAILAGLLSAIVAPIAGVAFGTRSTATFGPRSVPTFLLGSVILHHVVRAPAASTGLTDGTRVLTVVFFIVLLAGLFQAALGALRLGTLIKYVPAPVMAGFQNAVAILIVAAQLGALLGVPGRVAVSEILGHLDRVQPLTLAVGLLTVVTILSAPRFTRRVPPVALGIGTGTLLYYALALSGHGAGLGAVLGAAPAVHPVPGYVVGFGWLLTTGEGLSLVAPLAAGAFSVAIVASLDALLCQKTLDGMTGSRTEGGRVLVQLGLANAATACFGGITAGVNLAVSSASRRAGARTWLAPVMTGLVILGAGAFLGPVIGLLPRAVVAGILIVVAVQLVDRWSLRLARRLLARNVAGWRMPALDLAVVALVTTATIVFDLVTAVLVGVAIAVIVFLLRMSRSVVRRSYRGDVVHSKRTRHPRLMEALGSAGRSIVVWELEGPLFFGTADDLARRIESAHRAGDSHVILDCKRVNEVDSTGARILLQIDERLRQQGARLLLSHAASNDAVAGTLRGMGVTAALGPAVAFADTDAALEHAEDQILAALGAAQTDEATTLERLPALAGLTEAEYAVVRPLLVRRVYKAGDVVIREGDRDRSLFMTVRGAASVRVSLPGEARSRRLATYSGGTVFGEIALLDAAPRSATVTADEELICYILSGESFDLLTQRHPSIVIHLLKNLGLELSRRLRNLTVMVSQLE